MQANYVQRLRIIFAKEGPTRYIGHLDLARTWERALNRANIPIAYTQGYNQRPRMQVAAPLPLGYTSSCELIDLWLREALEPAEAQRQIMSRMAPGIRVVSVEAVDLRQPALQTLTRTATYTVRFPFDALTIDQLQERVATLQARPEIMRPRRGKKNRGKTFDLKPLIIDLRVREKEGEPELWAHLHLATGRTGRPDDVVAELGLDPLDVRIHRESIVVADVPAAP